jgi:hypothetical protein
MPTSTSRPPVVVGVPQQAELNGIGVWRKAVIVQAAEPIGLYGMSIADEGSCDGFLALPTSSLGSVYYAMCFFPPNYQSEIGIVAVHDGTVVNVTLYRNPPRSVYIQWSGVTYNNYDTNVITIPMKQYDTVQLQADR